MKQTRMWLSTAGLLVLLGSNIGCRSNVSQPWAGKSYQPPMGYTNQPMATYAPMPKLLPSKRSAEPQPSIPIDDSPESILSQADW